ncbi:MAG: hypothetical protein RBS56_00530 [Candidatus Gracilibacteria bacterium]|jgi:AcrR family transcriptional regulator|nr:hypothetical protein [Candidatus Gracilibacteria bacterium]
MKKTIVLGDKEELMKRLCEIDFTPYLRENFYHIIARAEGTELDARGVVNAIFLAIREYAASMSPLYKTLKFLHVGRFIDSLIDFKIMALLIDAVANDEELAKEAKEYLLQSRSK